MTRRRLEAGSQAFNVRSAVDNLRGLIAKAEAFTTTADDVFAEVHDDLRRRERLAYLVTEGAGAVQAALEAADKLAADLVDHGVGK